MPADLPALELRARIVRRIREFFFSRNFIEVETPVRIPVPALEPHIDAEPSGNCYLRTSPEFHMKRLLADGCARIFQLGPCFRQGESGRFHSPEYSMLEWYRTDADYLDVLVDAKALISDVAAEVLTGDKLVYAGTEVELMPEWISLSVQQAFESFAGWNPVEQFDAKRFDLDMVTRVEPALPKDKPVILKDYPREAAALAKCRLSDSDSARGAEIAERWELYIAGIELANAFSELTDPEAQAQRFEEWAAARRTAGRPAYPVDHEFMAALNKGMPECAGVALGVDRLVMLFANKMSVNDVRAFESAREKT